MAKVITVNNRLDLAVADFPSLQAAYDNASAGDTLLVYPSETTYAGIDISKKVILIGSGFTSTANLPATKISGSVNFLAGSDGSVIESFGGEFTITISNVNNISIYKNALSGLIVDHSFSTLLLGNTVHSIMENYRSKSSLIIKSNCLVEASNNMIRTTDFYSTPTIAIEGTSALNINNSIIIADQGIAFSGGVVKGKNNLVYGSLQNTSVDFYFTLNKDGSSSNEFWNLFNESFHLKSDSPASGSGENGTDMGIYGGVTPFVDGGYPSIPIIYQLDVPITGSQKDGISVTVKAKTDK